MMTRKPSAPHSQGRVPFSPLRASDPGLDSLLPLVHPDLPRPPPLDAPWAEVEELAKKDRRKSWVIGALFALCLVSTGTLAALFVSASEAEGPLAKSPAPVDIDVAPPKPTESLAARAAQGDLTAVQELEAKEPWERTPEEVVALDSARLVERRGEVQALGDRLRQIHPREVTRKHVDLMLAGASDEFTYQQALRSMAEIPNYVGPDLLFRVTRDFRTQTEVVTLAKELLRTARVSERASIALSIALEAENIESCEEARGLLERAENDADRRAVPALSRFAQKTGCGEFESEDCFACLREDRLLVRGLNAAQGRIEPQY